MFQKQDIKNLIKKPIFVSPSISLLDLLYEMRAHYDKIARSIGSELYSF